MRRRKIDPTNKKEVNEWVSSLIAEMRQRRAKEEAQTRNLEDRLKKMDWLL